MVPDNPCFDGALIKQQQRVELGLFTATYLINSRHGLFLSKAMLPATINCCHLIDERWVETAGNYSVVILNINDMEQPYPYQSNHQQHHIQHSTDLELVTGVEISHLVAFLVFWKLDMRLLTLTLREDNSCGWIG